MALHTQREIGAYHSAHPASADSGLSPVRWYPYAPRTARARVRDYTCDCLPIFFEFCVAGGLAFIRRYERSASRTIVMESHAETWRRTETLWNAILKGQAG